MELKFINGLQSQVAVVADSINRTTGKRIVTYQLRYPRFIHSEFMTHRVLGRNASSSRAIPSKKLIAQVIEAPAFFVWVGQNQSGMQAREEVPADIKAKFEAEWRELGGIVAGYCDRWANEYNVHKQTANRALEPWTYISVIVTATEWDNFFALRDHPDAQPEIRELAGLMKIARDQSHPRVLNAATNPADPRAWHLPYVTMDERKAHNLNELLAISAARCCRVSYLNHDKTHNTLEQNIELHDSLFNAKPMHASPFEHQAMALNESQASGNLRGGWGQYRVMLESLGLEGFRSRVEDQHKAALHSFLSQGLSVR